MANTLVVPRIKVTKDWETMGRKYCPYDFLVLTEGSLLPGQSQRYGAETPNLGGPDSQGCVSAVVSKKKIKNFQVLNSKPET